MRIPTNTVMQNVITKTGQTPMTEFKTAVVLAPRTCSFLTIIALPDDFTTDTNTNFSMYILLSNCPNTGK